MNTKIEDAVDKYLEKPIRYDFVFIAIALCLEYVVELGWRRFNLPLIKVIDRAKELDYISSVVSGSVALAGFMVAALTIFISIKASLKARGIEDAENALEIIFSTGHYKNIIAVFKNTIIELIILFIILYLFWLYSANLTDVAIFKVLLCSIFIIGISVVRSLYILFDVLDLEGFKKEE